MGTVVGRIAVAAAAVVQAGVNDGLTGAVSTGDDEEWSDSGLMIWMQSVREREESKMPKSQRREHLGGWCSHH